MSSTFARLIRLHDALYERMAHHITRFKELETDALYTTQHLKHVSQPG